jgi:hypothetical protein
MVKNHTVVLHSSNSFVKSRRSLAVKVFAEFNASCGQYFEKKSGLTFAGLYLSCLM